MRLRFLGTGTSFGIPVVGCTCDVCTSDDPHDTRSRHAAMLESDADARVILIDAPPELRLQLVAAGASRVDAVWFTHTHADHTHGIDDLRVFSARARRPLDGYADAASAEALRRRFAYIFDAKYRPPAGTTKPEMRLVTFEPDVPITVAGFTMIPVEVSHGDSAAFGFRIGELGYVTDAKRIPPASRRALDGVRVLVLNALWFGNPHPTHFNVEEAVEAAREIGAEQTFLTHLTHRVRHADLERRLPPDIRPAYDGLVVPFSDAS